MRAFESSRWSKAAAFAGILLLPPLQAGAGESAPRPTNLQLHGFATQGVVVTDQNNFFGPSSDRPSLQFIELGLNASVRPRPDTLIAGQVISRRAGGERSDAQPAIDYLLVDRQMHAGPDGHWGIRVGRAKNPFGLFNETRDVAFTRPGILLPQSIYFDRTRSLALSSDGVAVYADRNLPAGDVRLRLGIGRPQTGEDLEWVAMGSKQPGSFRGKTSVIGQALYEHDGGRIIAALSAADTGARFRSPPDGPGNVEFSFTPWILSLQYNAEQWSLTGEYARRPSSLAGFNPPFMDFDVTGESAYLEYSRRLNHEWTWRLRYDVLYTDHNDRSGQRFAQATGLPAHTRFAKDWSVGLQWQVNPNLMLAAEYHRVDGTGWLPGPDNPDPTATSRRWDMLLGQASLRF
ncbi:hypothetical protein TVNIR_3573 [Thioalkalivibrio nitratireducens DSM 14787]|uniref:Phosphate-selective porin O and P n=1 Tax=Thioalkalivibrio nitratireducens (strain DSM 14787 / UNIQEM 213 / ALEN2) TaxID=1255043 RepID=L0E1N0_THIND|nr:hypothetical protein [Thioalkalivibrio nitratireducens]AGA35203.1 hypothetical protein TVNIR_3573 [Thioalkalivibrio nitratireducens DSM 14787]